MMQNCEEEENMKADTNEEVREKQMKDMGQFGLPLVSPRNITIPEEERIAMAYMTLNKNDLNPIMEKDQSLEYSKSYSKSTYSVNKDKSDIEHMGKDEEDMQSPDFFNSINTNDNEVKSGRVSVSDDGSTIKKLNLNNLRDRINECREKLVEKDS